MALNALEHALRVPLVWTAEETDLMLNAFTEAHEQRGRGIRESLFAAAAALLRSRQKDAGIHTRMEGDRRLMIANRRDYPERRVHDESSGDAVKASNGTDKAVGGED